MSLRIKSSGLCPYLAGKQPMDACERLHRFGKVRPMEEEGWAIALTRTALSSFGPNRLRRFVAARFNRYRKKFR